MCSEARRGKYFEEEKGNNSCQMFLIGQDSVRDRNSQFSKGVTGHRDEAKCCSESFPAVSSGARESRDITNSGQTALPRSFI